jgi:hypothetical protein
MMRVTAQMPPAFGAVVLATVAVLANRLKAEWAFSRYHDVFALAVPTGLGDFSLFAFPAANLSQASFAAAVGTAAVMAAGQTSSAHAKRNRQAEQQSFHFRVLVSKEAGIQRAC